MGNTDTLSYTHRNTNKHTHTYVTSHYSLPYCVRSKSARHWTPNCWGWAVHVALEARSYTWTPPSRGTDGARTLCVWLASQTSPPVSYCGRGRCRGSLCRFSATRAVLNEACASASLASGTATSSPLTATAVLLGHHLCARISANPISHELQSSVISVVGPAVSHHRRHTRLYAIAYFVLSLDNMRGMMAIGSPFPALERRWWQRFLEISPILPKYCNKGCDFARVNNKIDKNNPTGCAKKIYPLEKCRYLMTSFFS